MCADGGTGARRRPPTPPKTGAIVVDVARDVVAEFRAEWCGKWYLRPVLGGKEWSTNPSNVQPANSQQKLKAKLAKVNARSRGEVL